MPGRVLNWHAQMTTVASGYIGGSDGSADFPEGASGWFAEEWQR